MMRITKSSFTLIYQMRFRLTVFLMFICFATSVQAQLSGNPLFSGADPEIHYFENKY